MLKAEPGTYALVCATDSAKLIDVGRLGRFQMRAGYYLYVGSAFGPGGIRARIDHHLRPSPHPHWHIDYLRMHVRLEAVWSTCDTRCREHLWAQVVGERLRGEVLRDGFGSSDCDCRSHLFHFDTPPSFRRFVSSIHAADRRHAAMHEFRIPGEA